MTPFHKLIVLIVLVLLGSSSGSALEHAEESSFDYETGDYSAISDWSSVDWSQIPPNRIPDVPADKLDYSQLSFGQRQDTTSEQIGHNLENIDNLAVDVNEQRAREAIEQKTGVVVDSLGEGAHIENGILRATFGESGSFAFAAKEQWRIKIDGKGRIFVLEPGEIHSSSLNANDHFTLQEFGPSDFIAPNGERVHVSRVSFKGTTMFVHAGDEGIVGRYLIESPDEVTIFLSPQGKSSGNYVSFDDHTLNAGTAPNSQMEVAVIPGNKLFNLVRRDYATSGEARLVPDDRDKLSFFLDGGDSFSVQSREDVGKTPLVQHHHADGMFRIETGRIEIRAIYEDTFKAQESSGGGFYVKPPKPLRGNAGPIPQENSAAFELISDVDPNQVLRTSSSNRYELIHVDSNSPEGKVIGGSDLGLKVSNRIEDNLMKGIPDLKHKYPQIQFQLSRGGSSELKPAEILPPDYGDITPNLAQVTDQWLADKPGVEKIFPTIYFDTVRNAAAGIDANTHFLRLGERVFDPSTFDSLPIRDFHNLPEIIDHEFAHGMEHYITYIEEGWFVAPTHILTPPERGFLEKEGQVTYDQQEYVIDSNDPRYVTQRDALAYSLKRRVTDNLRYISMVEESQALVSQLNLPDPDDRDEINDLLSSSATSVTDGVPGQITAFDQALNTLRYSLYKQQESTGQKKNPQIQAAWGQVEQLDKEFNDLVRDNTGLYPYSFTHRSSISTDVLGIQDNYGEITSTIGELPPAEIRQRSREIPELMELAHLERDRAYSVANDGKPSWVIENAEARWNAITGGVNGDYCQQNPEKCRPCSAYSWNCKPPR